MSSTMIGWYDTWLLWGWVLQGKVPKNTLKIAKSSFAAVIQYVHKWFDTVFDQKVKHEEKNHRNRYAVHPLHWIYCTELLKMMK